MAQTPAWFVNADPWSERRGVYGLALCWRLGWGSCAFAIWLAMNVADHADRNDN